MKITGSLQGITDTGSRIEAAMANIAIGVPITAETSIAAMAGMETRMAIDITGNGNPMSEDITVTGGAMTAVSVVGDMISGCP